MPGYEFVYLSLSDYKWPFKELRYSRRLLKEAARSCLILVSPSSQSVIYFLGSKPVIVRPLPEGVEFEAFDGVGERSLPFPDDLFNVKNPIIGHFGPLDARANLHTVEKAAEAHPEWSFVFVGPVRTDVTELRKFPNVHILGEKPRLHLPAYISRFDVCIGIAKSDGASAENLYQYLATGKPVVSAPHPAQALDYTEAIYLAGTPEEFIALCKKAIGERDAWKVRRRVEYGRAASWDARAAELERLIKEGSLSQ
jgi:glycosyltransferase involved in cell wall biosynthesis